MRTHHKRRSAKSGLPPGTLMHLGEQKLARTSIGLIEYGADGFAERQFDSLAAWQASPATLPVQWLNVYGLHEPEVLAEIGRRYQLHPLVVEDILNTDQRPKLDDYGNYLFLVARFFNYDEHSATVSSEQVSLVIGRGFVLSFQEQPSGTFNPLRERVRQDRGQIRLLGADYLAYSLLDAVVDRYFAILEAMGEQAERLEEQLMKRPTRASLEMLHRLRRETQALRRAIWPLREVINGLTRHADFFGPAVQPYLRDIYDHTVHLIESLESIRDLIGGLLEIYLSTVSNRVNQEVRVLTVIALIFMPATLLAGIFGMNFKFMPLVGQADGFALVLGLMAGIAATLGLVFWRRRWLA